MKFRVQKQIIESILTNLQPFLEKRDASQITSHIYFEIKAQDSVIKASDLEIGLQITTDQLTVQEEGNFTANGKKLLDIVRILKDGEIEFELIDETILIKQQNSKFKLPIFNPETYPKFPSIENKPKISLDSLNLIKNLRKITPAIDTNNPKYELNGALINIKSDRTDLVGTDTKRLAIATIKNSSDKELSLIIPKKAILEIQKLFFEQIDIYYDETNLVISNRNYLFFSRLINGKFPDYERIIPQKLKYKVELPKKDMLSAIKMITTISQDIKIVFLENSILFHSLSADNVEAKTKLELKTGIKDRFEISLNSRYILDFLAQIEKDKFIIGLNDSTLPFVVKDDNFLTIIMPIIA